MKKHSLIIVSAIFLLPFAAFSQQYNLKVTLTKRSWCDLNVGGCYAGWDGILYLSPTNTGRETRVDFYHLPEVGIQTVFYYTLNEPIAGKYANTEIMPEGCTDCHPLPWNDSDWLPGEGQPCGSRSVANGLMYLEYSVPALRTPWPVDKPEDYFQTNSLLCSDVITIETHDYGVNDTYHWQINPNFTANPDDWREFSTTTSPRTTLSKEDVAAALGVTPQSLTGQSLRLRVRPTELACNFVSRASTPVEIVFDGNFPNRIDFLTEQTCAGQSTGAITFTNIRNGNGTAYNFSTSLTFAVGLLDASGDVFIVRNLDSSTGEPFRISGLQAGRWVTTVFYDTNESGLESPSGCTAFLDTVEVTSRTGISFSSITPDSPTCRGGSDGSIAINVQNGLGPFTYWVNGSPVHSSYPSRSATISSRPSNTYRVQVTDLGCSASTPEVSTTIVDPTSLEMPVAQPFDAACAGTSSGVIAVAIANGAGNYMYRLENQAGATVGSTASPTNSPTHSFQGLPAGNYRAYVTDANGCSDMHPRDVSQWLTIGVAAPITATVDPVAARCHGENVGAGTGQLIFTVSGGTGSYRYFANGVEYFTNQVMGLNAGDYIPMVMDARTGASTCTWGGTSGYTETIGEPSAITLTIDEPQQPSCFGEGDGLISATAANGTPFSDGSYTYTLHSETRGFIESRSSVSFSSLNDIHADTYYFTIRDMNNCVVDSRDVLGEPIVVGQPDLLRINPVFSVVSGGLHNITCADSTDGWIQVNPAGGTAPFAVSLYLTSNPGSSLESTAGMSVGGSVTFSGHPAGAYTLVVEDAHACETILDTLLLEPDPLVIDPISIREYLGNVNVSCNGSADGEITINATGGNYPYSLTINQGPPVDLNSTSLPHTASGLAAGPYDVRIIDPNGCHTQQGITLTEPDSLIVSDIFISNPGAAPFEVQCHGNLETLSIITAGGSVDRTVEINSVVRTVTAGIAADFPSLGAGTYTYDIADENGCTLSDNITITEPEAISLNAAATLIDKPRCFGESTGSLQLQALGGVKIDGTEYRYVLTHLNVPPDLPFPFDQVRELAGDLIVFENLIAGEYEISVYDRFTCVFTTNETIETEAQIGIAIGSTDITCKADRDGSGSVTINGGIEPYTLIWQNAFRQQLTSESVNENVPAVLNSLSEGIYYIRVSDASGCEFYNPNFTFEVQGPAAPLVLSAQPSMVTCNGFGNGIVILDATGGWQESPYRFGTNPAALVIGNTFFEDLSPGMYTYYAEDSRGCTDTLSVSITEPEEFTSFIAGEEMVSCFGAGDGSFVISMSGGTAPYEMSIDNGNTWEVTNSFDGLGPATYTVLLRDARGCAGQEEVPITEPLELLASIAGQENTLCQESNGSVTANVHGGTVPYTLVWTNDNDDVLGNGLSLNNLFAGDYLLTVTDDNDCVTELPVGIINTNDIVFEVTGIGDVLCYGGADGHASLSISAIQAPYTILWDNGASTNAVSNLVAGTHTVTLADANQCEVTEEFTIGTPEELGVVVTSRISPVCYGDCNGRIETQATGGMGTYSYSWPERGIASRILQDVCAGDHLLHITDQHGCEFEETITLAGPEEIDLGLNDSYSICQGQTVNLGAGDWISYNWSSANGFSSSSQNVTLTKAGVYDVLVTDPAGCEGTASFEIIFSNELLQAEFLLPKETHVGDTIVCIDISYPEPAQLQWDFDSLAASAIASYGAYKELVFNEPGEFDIILTSRLGECMDQQTKTITVHERLEETNPGGRLGHRASGIKEFKIYPNPTDGKFRCKVVLYKTADLRLQLIGFNGSIINDHVKSGSDEYEVAFNIATRPTGVYWLVAEGDGKTKTLRVLIE